MVVVLLLVLILDLLLVPFILISTASSYLCLCLFVPTTAFVHEPVGNINMLLLIYLRW